jgi:hypothetical protein
VTCARPQPGSNILGFWSGEWLKWLRRCEEKSSVAMRGTGSRSVTHGRGLGPVELAECKPPTQQETIRRLLIYAYPTIRPERIV